MIFLGAKRVVRYFGSLLILAFLVRPAFPQDSSAQPGLSGAEVADYLTQQQLEQARALIAQHEYVLAVNLLDRFFGSDGDPPVGEIFKNERKE